MRQNQPTSMIAYASMIEPNNEELLLPYKKGYFHDKTLQIEIDNIKSFTLSNCCSIFYFLTEDGYLHLYEIESGRVEKNIFGVEESESIIDIVKWENSLFVLTHVGIRAYSMITGQCLWEKPLAITEELKALAIDEQRYIYLLTSDKIFKTHYHVASPVKELSLEDLPQNHLSLFIKESYLYVIEASKIVAYHKERLKREESLTVDLSAYMFGSMVKKIIYTENNLWVLDNSGELSSIYIHQQNIYEKKRTFRHVFNSTQLGCRWHTMELSFDIPDKGGVVEFKIRAYDNENNRGAVETFENRTNIYFENMIGQYMEVEITLFSDPQQSSSPTFKSMRVFFPKKTYLEHLPALYQEDESSRLLLERYLSVFQTINRGIEEEIESSHLKLDPQTAPTEFLEWLSLWVGLTKQAYWSDEKWRILLTKSSYFFKKRGTREGLIEIIKLYTDEEPMVVELFQWYCQEDEQETNRDLYSFCVLFTPKQIANREELKIVRQIIDFWKPAHTTGRVTVLSKSMRLGEFIFLGKNSYIGQEEPFILGEAILPFGTRITDREDSIQIESHSRLGIDTNIKY